MDNPRDEEKKIYDFLNINRFDNYILKFSTTNINTSTYVDNILSVLHTLNPVGYDYNRRLYSYINRTTKILKSDYKTLLFKKIKERCEFFEKYACFVSSCGSIFG